MELFEYIKSQLPQMPNTVIMKQLGASQELIDYVKETPENTNFAIAEVIEGSGGSGDAEVWLVGNEAITEHDIVRFELSNVDSVDHITELFTNANNYIVFLNGEELPYLFEIVEEGMTTVTFADNENEQEITKMVQHYENESHIYTEAWYFDTSTAPTSVEVSVKTK